MDDIDQAALDAATAIMQGPKHINPVREKARIQLIIIDAMKQWNTRHTPEGWQLVYDALDKVKDMVPDDEVYEQCVDALSAAPKWGGE